MDSLLPSNARPASITAFLLAAVLVVLIMTNGSATLIPIVIAVGVWLVINDITNAIHRVKIGSFQLPRGVAMAVGLLIILILMRSTIGIMLRNIRDFSDALPIYTENLRALVNTIPESVWINLIGTDVDMSGDMLSQLFEYASTFFNDALATLIASATNDRDLRFSKSPSTDMSFICSSATSIRVTVDLSMDSGLIFR